MPEKCNSLLRLGLLKLNMEWHAYWQSQQKEFLDTHPDLYHEEKRCLVLKKCLTRINHS